MMVAMLFLGICIGGLCFKVGGRFLDTKLLESNDDVVRGAISDIVGSLYECPDEWVRSSENQITHKHSKIGVHIGDGQDGVRVLGSISISDLWAEEQEILWDATKFWESSHISKMLSAHSEVPSAIPTGKKKDLFSKGEQIGRQYKLLNGTPVPIDP